MKLIALTTALAVAAAAPAFANSDQLARSLGVEPGVLTTLQLAQVKGAIDNADDNRQAKALIERFTSGEVRAESTGVSAGHAQLAARFGVDPSEFSVAQLVAIKAFVDNDEDNRSIEAAIASVEAGGVVSTMSTGISAGHVQLAGSLGLDAADYSIAELAAIKAGRQGTAEQNE